MENTNKPTTKSSNEKNGKIGSLRKVTSTVTGKKFLAGYLKIEDEFGVEINYDIRVIPNNNKRDEKDCDFFVFGDPVKSLKSNKLLTKLPDKSENKIGIQKIPVTEVEEPLI